MSNPSNPPERVNKVLAKLGYGSRRAVDALVAQSRITINGQPAQLGQRVTESDHILIDNKPITWNQPRSLILAFNKPAGVTTTKADPHAKLTIMHFLPPDMQHVFPVGRLDRDSRGLLILTTDGDLALRLQHPRYNHEKEYKVKVASAQSLNGQKFAQDLKRLGTTIVAPEHQTKPIIIKEFHLDESARTGYARVILTEGKKRQIRELFKQLGYAVIDLQRIRIGKLSLDNLKEGQYREVSLTEI